MERIKAPICMLIFVLLNACIYKDQEDQPKWKLVFEEHFDSTLHQWNVWESGAFNQEIQLYQPEQLTVSDGKLEIVTRRQEVSGKTHIGNAEIKPFEYVSGRIESKVLFAPSNKPGEHRYLFQARIKLPSGHGMWPAFWTYGDPWPTKGEIDILEFRGGEPARFQTNIFYGDEPSKNINRNSVRKFETQHDLTSGFHIYEMTWSQDSIEIFLDGEKLHTYYANEDNNIRSFFGKKQKVVLNTAVGGVFFEDRNSANYADSASMSVDWVKVFKQ